jgi:hypothetical protein
LFESLSLLHRPRRIEGRGRCLAEEGRPGGKLFPYLFLTFVEFCSIALLTRISRGGFWQARLAPGNF